MSNLEVFDNYIGLEPAHFLRDWRYSAKKPCLGRPTKTLPCLCLVLEQEEWCAWLFTAIFGVLWTGGFHTSCTEKGSLPRAQLLTLWCFRRPRTTLYTEGIGWSTKYAMTLYHISAFHIMFSAPWTINNRFLFVFRVVGWCPVLTP